MSKKRNAKKPTTSPSAGSLLYPKGTSVQVRSGATDPNYPDIPLGGYTGVVTEADAESTPPLYLIAWDERTIEEMPSVLKLRSERDGFEWDEMWLEETDLEAVASEPTALQQPTQLAPRPLDFEEPEDRVRAIFELTSDDEIPQPDQKSLEKFHAHLSQRLRLPQEALYIGDLFAPRPDLEMVLLTRLLDPSEADPAAGLLVEISRDGHKEIIPLVQLVLPEDSPSHRPVMDYTQWYSIFADDDGEGRFFWEAPFPIGPKAIVLMCLRLMVYAAGIGASLGSMLNAFDNASTAMMVGAGILGVLGFLTYSQAQANNSPSGEGGSLGGSLAGGLLGGLVGGVVGILFVGVIGTLPGAILGSLLGKGLAALGQRPMGDIGWSLFGAFGGGLGWAIYKNKDAALDGARVGAISGASACFVLALLVFLVLNVGGGEPNENGPSDAP